MLRADKTAPCRNCGRPFPGTDLDRRRWCPECRAEVIRQATWWGRGAGVLFAAGLGIWVLLAVRPEQFLVLWLVFVALVYLFVSTLVRRVAFAVIRERGVSLPREARG